MSALPPGEGRTPRWGLRTLAFLVLAAVSIIGPEQLRERGVQYFNLLGFLGLVVGLVGAGVCTARGIRAYLDTRRG
jgi:hypothetical protein